MLLRNKVCSRAIKCSSFLFLPLDFSLVLSNKSLDKNHQNVKHKCMKLMKANGEQKSEQSAEFSRPLLLDRN